MPIKVLSIITKLELGGAQKNAIELLAGLEKNGFEVHLVSSDGYMRHEAGSVPGAKVKIVKYLKREPDPFFDILSVFMLARYMRKNRIDIVHTHSSKAGIVGRFAARLAGIPVVIHTIHGWGFHGYQNSLASWFYIQMERIAAGFTTKFIAVTHSDIRKGLKCRIGRESQYFMNRCGITFGEKTMPKEAVSKKRRLLGLAEEDMVIGTVACFKKQKNHVDLIECASNICKDHPNAKFLLVGDGALRPKIVALINRYGLQNNVQLLGWRRDVNELLQLMDVFMLTSLWEGLPVSVLEAQSMGLPVVAYNVCGVNEAIKDGVNGFLVRTGDIELLCDRLGQLLSNAALRKRMGDMGKCVISTDEFSSAKCVSRTIELYCREFKKAMAENRVSV
ncbi:MAG TPA: glycosyltransferase family 4 protein [Candidatus Omnitrophota bacterium]|nr:glycosyltransferase family 4 protein [Candidatus Omnitrophota bacterium]